MNRLHSVSIASDEQLGSKISEDCAVALMIVFFRALSYQSDETEDFSRFCRDLWEPLVAQKGKPQFSQFSASSERASRLTFAASSYEQDEYDPNLF